MRRWKVYADVIHDPYFGCVAAETFETAMAKAIELVAMSLDRSVSYVEENLTIWIVEDTGDECGDDVYTEPIWYDLIWYDI